MFVRCFDKIIIGKKWTRTHNLQFWLVIYRVWMNFTTLNFDIKLNRWVEYLKKLSLIGFECWQLNRRIQGWYSLNFFAILLRSCLRWGYLNISVVVISKVILLPLKNLDVILSASYLEEVLRISALICSLCNLIKFARLTLAWRSVWKLKGGLSKIINLTCLVSSDISNGRLLVGWT